jgi:hypothetical protein
MKELLIRHLMPAPWAWLGLILFLILGIANGQCQRENKIVVGYATGLAVGTPN